MFEIAFAFTVAIEGGYVNHPNDPGGAIKWGISQRQYPNLDIQGLTKSRAKNIYRTDYWETIHGDELPPAIAVIAFDTAVNSGTTVAIKELQAVAGCKQDGRFGPKTRQALARSLAMEGNRRHYAKILLQRRAKFYAELDNKHFQRGWMNRMVALCFEAGQCSM